MADDVSRLVEDGEEPGDLFCLVMDDGSEWVFEIAGEASVVLEWFMYSDAPCGEA